MITKIDRNSNTMTISSFHEGFLLKKYNMSPDYQRQSVWGDEQQSLLIDSILKNIPIPPIFLREIIDENGKTKYEVIDGKQRLTSIIKFIDGKLSTTDDANDPLHNSDLAGVSFEELRNNPELKDSLYDFWGYPIPIEYIKTKDDSIIDRIFDRLNRSGEKLNGQELRNANYYNSKLIQLSYKLSKGKYWKKALEITDKKRMEDIQLISEFLFLLIEDRDIASSDAELDKLYKKYARNTKDISWGEIESKFKEITNFIIDLDIDLEKYNITGVSHLYGIWSFSKHCVEQGSDINNIKNKINKFYSIYKTKDYDINTEQSKYKKTMEYNTKGATQRKRRKEALIRFCL